MYNAIPYNPSDKQVVYIDVRSESEYTKGHIINAINIPILEDAERHEVGWLYKNASIEKAKRVGIQYGSQKLDAFFQAVQDIRNEKPDHKITFYCARGGYRSRSIALFMRGIDMPVFWLAGGYKSYRQVVQTAINKPEFFPRFIVLNGLSGVCKTHVLSALAALGQPCLDLEGAANHKGSHLGAIGTNGVQSVQKFENTLYDYLSNVKSTYCFVESESKRIGHVFLTNALYDGIQKGSQLLLEASYDFRIAAVVQDYTTADNFDELIRPSMQKIKPYLPVVLYKEMMDHLEAKNMEKLAELLLKHHYDPIYQKSINNNDYVRTFTVSDIEACAIEIVNWLNHSALFQ